MIEEIELIKIQIGRIVSDIESEKDTRKRSNERFDRKIEDMKSDLEGKLEMRDKILRSHDRAIYMGIGGLAVLQIVLAVILATLK